MPIDTRVVENEAPSSILQELQHRSEKVTDESLESTRRMLAYTEASKEAGIQILVELDDQGEKLCRIEEGNDQINEDMKETEKNLAGMEKCCGLCILPCQKASSFKEDKEIWKANGDGKIVTCQPLRTVDGHNAMGSHGGYIQRLTKDEREDEMEENLKQVNGVLGNLRNMAVDIGCELESQEDQINRVKEKVQSNEIRIDGANKRVDKLL